MSAIDIFVTKAKNSNKILVLPEGQDPRVVVAANRIVAEGVADVIVLGTDDEISASCTSSGLVERNFTSLDHTTSNLFEEFCAEFCEIRKKKNMTMEKAAEYMKNRIFFGSMMTRKGNADGMVAGSIASTADMLRASFTIIGTSEGITTGSSCFVMDLASPTIAGDEVILYADCGVNPDPDATQLVDIALATASTYNALLGKTPKIAFLSFATHGSANHASLDKIREAAKMMTKRVNDENLDIIVDGRELQADAAIVPAVAKSKCKTSPLAGEANVLIFPDLNSGNICYKLTQRLAGAGAYGPILQGLAKPVNDLSRGCSADDIFGVAAITVCQSAC